MFNSNKIGIYVMKKYSKMAARRLQEKRKIFLLVVRFVLMFSVLIQWLRMLELVMKRATLMALWTVSSTDSSMRS